jgi:Leucine-rich repeat (LRR) protein
VEQVESIVLNVGAVSLDLSDLGLTEVPASVAQLTNLQSLYLYYNQLTSTVWLKFGYPFYAANAFLL